MSILPAEYHYILLALAPPCDALRARKALQDALAQSFGLAAAGTYIDVLWVSPGAETETRAVIRARQADAVKIMAAAAAATGAPRASVVRHSGFLPALL